jgi:hypothetical protein
MSRVAGVALVLLSLGASVRAEVVNCTDIPSLPFVITAPGVYCLKASLDYASGSGIALMIAADDVVVDMNDHLIDGSTGGPRRTPTASVPDRVNVTVRNGLFAASTPAVLGGRNPRTSRSTCGRPEHGLRPFVRGQAKRSLQPVTRTGGHRCLAIGLYGLGDHACGG